MLVITLFRYLVDYLVQALSNSVRSSLFMACFTDRKKRNLEEETDDCDFVV